PAPAPADGDAGSSGAGGSGNGISSAPAKPRRFNGTPIAADDPTVTTVPGGRTTTTIPSTDGTTPATTPGVTTPGTLPVDPVPTPIAHAPVANADTFTGLLNTRYKIDVLANDTDMDGNLDPTTLVIVASSVSNLDVLAVEEGTIRVRDSSTLAKSFTIVYQVC